MSRESGSVGVFILAKNEVNNIPRTLSALANSGWDVHVMDSGSTDGTQEIAAAYDQVTVHGHRYVDHCTSYNEILTGLGRHYQVALILDADMAVTDDLQKEINALVSSAGGGWNALRAQVTMCVDGEKLVHGSLYPPKPIAFSTGRSLFESTGHAERLSSDVVVIDLQSSIIHDDRKPYTSFLQSQARYAEKLVSRYHAGAVSRRDRWRVRFPFLIVAVPFYSLFIKRGILAGRAGVLYALDRLIAEAVMFRHAVADRLKNKV